MLVQKIAPKVRPYVLTALLCVGMSPIFAKEKPQHDSFVKQPVPTETRTEIKNNDNNGYIKYLFRTIEWLPLVGFLGVIKIANYVEKKEKEEEEKEKQNSEKKIK